jgi:hypothetical protein
MSRPPCQGYFARARETDRYRHVTSNLSRGLVKLDAKCAAGPAVQRVREQLASVSVSPVAPTRPTRRCSIFRQAPRGKAA